MECPDVVIFDGITLGTIKKIPPYFIQFYDNQRIPPVYQAIRIFIPSVTKRKAIVDYLRTGLNLSAFKDLVQSLGIKPLGNYMKAGSIVNGSNISVKDIRDVIYYFTRNEPISGIFQFSFLEHD